MKCHAFPHCTACSAPILRALYPRNESNDPPQLDLNFIESVCGDSAILETISGVSDLTAGLDDLDLSDNGEDEEDI